MGGFVRLFLDPRAASAALKVLVQHRVVPMVYGEDEVTRYLDCPDFHSHEVFMFRFTLVDRKESTWSH